MDHDQRRIGGRLLGETVHELGGMTNLSKGADDDLAVYSRGSQRQ
ncbi:hypothetical protein WME98_14430 [Sorangium sp. So ce296]